MRKLPSQNLFKRTLVRDAGSPLRGSGAGVTLATNIKFGGTSLPHSLHGETQGLAFRFDIQNPANDVSFRRPEVQQAFIALAGDRVFRLAQVKYHRAVFDDDGVGTAGEESFKRAGKGL